MHAQLEASATFNRLKDFVLDSEYLFYPRYLKSRSHQSDNEVKSSKINFFTWLRICTVLPTPAPKVKVNCQALFFILFIFGGKLSKFIRIFFAF